MGRIRIVLPAMMCGLVACGATAPALAAPGPGAGWSATQCGREPAAPSVDTTTVDRYNASVDRVTAYERAARSYNGCVSKAATTEQTAISNDARVRIDAIQGVSGGVQKRIAANFSALTGALRAGAPKLQPSRSSH